MSDDEPAESADSAELTELDDVWGGSAGSSIFSLLEDNSSACPDFAEEELADEVSELAEVAELDVSVISSEGLVVLSPSEHATRAPATASAVANFVMKNADVCRAFLVRMGAS